MAGRPSEIQVKELIGRLRLDEYLSRVEDGEVLSIRAAEHFVELASSMLLARWGLYANCPYSPQDRKAKDAKRAYDDAAHTHGIAHCALLNAKIKRCGRCEHWIQQEPDWNRCLALKTTLESSWMFEPDGPPWDNCRRFEPSPETLGA